MISMEFRLGVLYNFNNYTMLHHITFSLLEANYLSLNADILYEFNFGLS